ncbi:MAG TPA: tRNA epoxyqueuosine(34) reductase QueG [Anaerolineales bacterium]|nr:tRNA epoxyqueuosine(34) reductase QueG [Anaerolineales bacterium]
MKTAILAEAHRLGFTLAGVTTPLPPPHFDVFTAWLQSGRHGEMAYLASERSLARRADPRQVLPECRSILVLGAPYPGGAVSSSPPAGGSVAAYAWNDDYHDVFAVRLRALVAFIETLAGHPIPNRWYTDSGPVLERDLAQRAGLGWIGKNTCLIHPQLGSYFLLAEILLGLDLEPDLPMLADHCGSCRRCIEACPTACILPDRTLDARRCISYLTIELKGPIPLDLRPLIGDWAFGCDICQQVCPWNRFAALEQVRQPVLAPTDDLSLSAEAFNRKFKNSPIRRSKRRGYLRNLAVVLGNQAAGKKNDNVQHVLVCALECDPEPLVRGHAAWALAQIGGREIQRALENALRREQELDVLVEIEQALNLILLKL